MGLLCVLLSPIYVHTVHQVHRKHTEPETRHIFNPRTYTQILRPLVSEIPREQLLSFKRDFCSTALELLLLYTSFE